jgi:diacylglycerol O-acyltransferase / wax synthase
VPDKLRVFAPVSVRDESQRYRLGNLVSAMVVEVPLAPMSPGDRVHLVTSITGDLKRSRAAVAAHTLTQLATWAPATLQSLAGRLMTSQLQWSPQSVINLVVTNIPGPQVPFYTGGARLLEIWPFVSIYHSLGLNVAVVSYDGSVFFGMLADRDLVPDLEEFARHLEQAIGDYRAAAVGKTPRRGRTPGGSRRRAARPRQKAAEQPVDLRIDEHPVVGAPNGDGGDVGSQAAAEVHDLV